MLPAALKLTLQVEVVRLADNSSPFTSGCPGLLAGMEFTSLFQVICGSMHCCSFTLCGPLLATQIQITF
jgi:hypothetical protein